MSSTAMDKFEDNSAESKPYNVIRPHELTDYTLMELKTLLEKTTPELGRDWSQRFRDRIVVSIGQVQSKPWTDVRTWLTPTPETLQNQLWFVMSFQSDVVGAQDAIVFPAALLSNMFDRLTGAQAPPTSTGTLETPLTTLEERLLVRIAESFSHQWEKAWEKFLPLKIQSVHAGDAFNLEDADPCAVCEFVVHWSQTNLSFYLVLPYYAVNDLLRRLDRSRLDWLNDFSTTSANIPTGIRKSKIRLTVSMAKSTVTTQEFLQLQPGDIITTDQDVDAPIEVYIQNRLKFLASPGQLHGLKAIEILDVTEN